jgi:hypothetical protein
MGDDPDAVRAAAAPSARFVLILFFEQLQAVRDYPTDLDQFLPFANGSIPLGLVTTRFGGLDGDGHYQA